MIEEFCKWDQGSKVNVLSERSIGQIDEDSLVVFVVELLLLQDWVLLLALFEFLPLLIEGFDIQLSSRNDGQISERV